LCVRGPCGCERPFSGPGKATGRDRPRSRVGRATRAVGCRSAFTTSVWISGRLRGGAEREEDIEDRPLHGGRGRVWTASQTMSSSSSLRARVPQLDDKDLEDGERFHRVERKRRSAGTGRGKGYPDGKGLAPTAGPSMVTKCQRSEGFKQWGHPRGQMGGRAMPDSRGDRRQCTSGIKTAVHSRGRRTTTLSTS
jgi:hypothetical protein